MNRRSYRQNCALAHGADIVGERWTLLIVRDLLVADRRYGELEKSLRGIGTNLLAARLKELEAAGLIERRGTAGRLYGLTPTGRALEPAVLALVRWGLTYGPADQPGFHHHDDWDLVALKAVLRPAAAVDVRVQFQTDDFEGWASIRRGQLEIGLGGIESPDIVISGTVSDLHQAAISSNQVPFVGDAAKLRAFVGAFDVPGADPPA